MHQNIDQLAKEGRSIEDAVEDGDIDRADAAGLTQIRRKREGGAIEFAPSHDTP